MKLPFALRHAMREIRSTWRRIGLYMVSITIGVGALVAINSFRTNIVDSIREQSRDLLGADLELHSNRAFPDSVANLLDSLGAAEVPISYVTTVPSMAYAPTSDFSRLVQVKMVTPGYPYYGTITTDPLNRWNAIYTGHVAVVDPAVTVELGISVGDTISINDVPFEVGGIITDSPTEINVRTAIGPRVFIDARFMEETALVRFGSMTRYQAYLAIPDNGDLQNFLNAKNQFFRDQQVSYDTVAERVEDMTEAVNNMTRFLGLVGLTALLLGGVGVASAIHVFVKEKLDTVAVLRCLGARQRTVFLAYVVQACGLGVLGAILGVAVGAVVQLALPSVLGGLIPTDVAVHVDLLSVVAGVATGFWVAGIFAMLPLMAIWDVTPLRALRREFESVVPKRRWWRVAAYAGLALSVLAISRWQAPVPSMAWGFAGGILATTLALWVIAKLLIWGTRRFFPRKARYVIRQGIANLFRPQNQTVAVTISLGFGVFLIATIYIVQRNILDRFDIDSQESRPNFATFDIQVDQVTGVQDIFANRASAAQVVPMVPSRISSLKGRPVEELLANREGGSIPRWALRREYRNTYRADISTSELLLEGTWWDAPRDLRFDSTASLARISVEQELADDLDLRIGDRITWDIQGVMIESMVTSIRSVNWARLDLNFFFVFEPGSLDDAPHTFVTMSRVNDPVQRAELQRDIVRRYPNIAVMDLGIIQQALDDIIGKVALAVRFMAAFSIASGFVVLIGAISTSRYHRIRESVLLKTLGASKRQLSQIFSTEYLALGSLAGLTGILLAALAGWGLIRFLFELSFNVPVTQLAILWLSATLATAFIGLAGNRSVLRRPPLAVIRDMND